MIEMFDSVAGLVIKNKGLGSPASGYIFET
jgi:hypothetical protein